MTADIRIETLDAPGLDQEAEVLADILHACVHAGASISFILPFTPADALAFWRGPVALGVAAGRRDLLVARNQDRIVGTVQLNRDTPPNQSHRADVAKLLVHPQARRLGIARRLMGEVEAVARQRGRWLLTLDTRAGDAAEPLYQALGYVRVGIIPDYARAPDAPRYEPCVFFHKRLET